MKKFPGIRQVLALCALTALTITAGAARAAEPVKVRLGDLAQALNSIASNVMIQQGFDKKHGIAVEYSTYPTLDGLFTAIRRLRAVHGRIADRLARGGLALYAQHVDAMDNATLVDVFRTEEDSCLLGTDAMRDGVDVRPNHTAFIQVCSSSVVMKRESTATYR